MKPFTWAAWILFGLEALFVASLYVVRNMGDDAAGRGMARGFAVVLAPVLLLAGGLLWWGGRTGVKPLFWIGFAIVASPVLLGTIFALRGGLRSVGLAAGRAQDGRFADRRLTAMARAIDRRDLDDLRRRLAAEGVDFAARDRFGHTLLGHAVHRVLESYADTAGVECVRALLEAGAPVDRRALAPERTSYAPEDFELIAAVFGGNTPGVVPLLDLLLQAGADPDVNDMFDEPIIFSSYATRAKLDALARHGADFTRLHTRTDRLGWSAAINAAELGNWDLVELFLAHGVPIDHVAPDGRSLPGILDEWASRERQAGGNPEEDARYQELVARFRGASTRTPRGSSP